jgi:hypothetical protein
MRTTTTRHLSGAAFSLPAVAILVLAGCGGGLSTKLTEPEEGKILVIGSVIIENVVGIGPLRESYTSGTTVMIMADIEEEGQIVRKGYNIWADEEGYYCVENLPYGRYTLKGIRSSGNRGGSWTIWNELRMPNERWVYVGDPDHPLSFTGEYFHYTERMNVFNFQHAIFSIMGGGTVYYEPRPKMENEAFHIEERYTRPYVEQYFIDKYPDSGWVPILQAIMPVDR